MNALVDWWAEHRRDLPWRDTRDPWAVLVAETMLQQTQVARVVPKYHAFLSRFPDVRSCAEASLADVLRAWDGLGYNRRAASLHGAATMIAERFAGMFPATLEELRELPGVGPYTSRAIAAFAFELDVAVVDTNVARVLARLGGESLRPAEAQARADALVPPGAGWAWNQAMVDVGAMVCTARRAGCDTCPLASCCRWRGRGPDPARGSAYVSKPQSRFAGSDRQGRGRLIAALRDGVVPAHELAVVMGWPDDGDRARRVAATVMDDGLVRFERGCYRLGPAASRTAPVARVRSATPRQVDGAGRAP